jgi:hypothetical protein
MMKEKLEEAIERKNNDLNSFIWKGRKEEVDGKFVQKEIKLMDCTEKELQDHFDYCETMLRNNDPKTPGRIVLINIIKDQRERCNAELFIRWIEQTTKSPRFTFMTSLRTFLDNNPDIKTDEVCVGDAIAGNCPAEFINIPISLVLDSCLDKLGKFDRSHITLAFILRQGLWFTPEESKDLVEKDNDGNIKNKIEVVKERLGLKSSINLYINPKGLSFTQLRAMINLRSKKYSELTTSQLETLRNRILFSLEEDANYHSKMWINLENQILKVAAAKGFTINGTTTV